MNVEFLELLEARAPGLWEELPVVVVLLAHLRRAGEKRSVRTSVDDLVNLVAARLAQIRRNAAFGSYI